MDLTKLNHWKDPGVGCLDVPEHSKAITCIRGRGHGWMWSNVLDRVSPLSGAAERGLGRFGRKRQEQRVFCRAISVGLLTVHPKACDILTYPATFACKSGQDHRHLIAEDRGARSSDCQWRSYLSMTFQWSHVSHLVTWYFSSDLNPCFPKNDSEKTFEF